MLKFQFVFFFSEIFVMIALQVKTICHVFETMILLMTIIKSNDIV